MTVILGIPRTFLTALTRAQHWQQLLGGTKTVKATGSLYFVAKIVGWGLPRLVKNARLAMTVWMV
jgi:hypothetical protein